MSVRLNRPCTYANQSIKPWALNPAPAFAFSSKLGAKVLLLFDLSKELNVLFSVNYKQLHTFLFTYCCTHNH